MANLSIEVSAACSAWLLSRGIESRPFGLNAAAGSVASVAGMQAGRPDLAPLPGVGQKSGGHRETPFRPLSSWAE